MLVEAFSALENIILGAEPVGPGGRLDRAQARARADEVLREAGLELDLDAAVDRLGVGERQTLEIVRVLYRGARIILLDEPTAVLTPTQSDALYATLRKLASDGAAIAVVTHRLSEVLGFCDDVTVMRRGKVVSFCPVSDTTEQALTREIMGREPPAPMKRLELAAGSRTRLAVRGLCVAGQRQGRLAVEDVSFEVCGGEVIGLAGVEGNGQQELVQALAGLVRASSGTIVLDGNPVTSLGVAERRALGLAVMHADRQREGLLLEASVSDNLVLGDLGKIDEAPSVARRIERFGVVPPEPARLARQLSGGNQQKVITARVLDRPLVAMVLAQPTRGVDLGAARTIHEAILQAVRGGAGALILSADLAELRALCHRVHVIARGRLVATLSPEASDETYGRAMLGAGSKQAAGA
jgi:simple sugar transport system ATP-binding protein